MIDAKKMRFDQYTSRCIVSNFQLHRDSLSKIPTTAETPSARTLSRSNLMRLSTLELPSWLLLPAASALSCHLLADHRFSLSALVKTMPSSLLLLVCIRFSHPWHFFLLRLGFFKKPQRQCLPFTFKFWQRVRPPLVITWMVAGHFLSGLRKLFCRSNFAILAICPHTLAGCVLWFGPETQLCFQVHPPPLAGSSTTVHSLLILQNAPPCYACSPLSACQVASV